METVARPFTYDTLKVGTKLVGKGRTITEADHGLFMLVSGDWEPIHCDEEYARTTPLGRRVVHGTYGITLALGSLQARLLESSDPLIAALGIKEWNYKAPLFVGDTVHVEIEIVNKRLTSKGDRYIVERLIRLINQHGTVVQEGRAESMWQRTNEAS
jgi:acyl dehydratase